jgi:hypothetical protein
MLKQNFLAFLAVSVGSATQDDTRRETVRYLRPVGDRFETECLFVIKRNDSGWTITSATDRGTLRMEVVSRYDPEDRLLSGSTVLKDRRTVQTATVAVKDGKATIRRPGKKAQEFDAPRGTIVTSAPDWSDIFLLCRRYDLQKKGKQEFPALWIHPGQPAQRLTFAIEWQGTDAIQRGGRKHVLSRFHIRIRNNSAYVAWADDQGKLVRLIPLPLGKLPSGLSLEGWEKAASELRPAP